MDIIKKILTSRKWLAGIVGFLLPILNEKLGWNISPDSVVAAIAALAAVIFGEAYKDGKALESVKPK